MIERRDLKLFFVVLYERKMVVYDDRIMETLIWIVKGNLTKMAYQ